MNQNNIKPQELLTGKAKEAFERSLRVNHYQYYLMAWGKLPYACQASMIIDFLDSVGIYITINFVDIFNEYDNKKGYEAYVTNKGLSTKYRPVASRHQATQEAIKKAVEIFNESSIFGYESTSCPQNNYNDSNN